MIGYPFIETFFGNILGKSSAIQGRFFICPKFGREINSDELGQVIQDLVRPVVAKKSPIALLMPPVSLGNYTSRNPNWDYYRAIMFFLKTTYYSSTNQVMTPNASTGTSMHTIVQDWHDMKRCAVNFVKAVDSVMRKNRSFASSFRLENEKDQIITPVSNVGADRYSGVRLDFEFSLYNNCTLEDYTQSDLDTIMITATDSHPQHQL